MKNVNEFLNDQLPKLNTSSGNWNRGYDQAVARIKGAVTQDRLEAQVKEDFDLFQKPAADSQWKLGFWSAYYDMTTYSIN